MQSDHGLASPTVDQHFTYVNKSLEIPTRLGD
jgi:hypothetical protein